MPNGPTGTYEQLGAAVVVVALVVAVVVVATVEVVDEAAWTAENAARARARAKTAKAMPKPKSLANVEEMWSLLDLFGLN